MYIPHLLLGPPFTNYVLGWVGGGGVRNNCLQGMMKKKNLGGDCLKFLFLAEVEERGLGKPMFLKMVYKEIKVQ